MAIFGQKKTIHALVLKGDTGIAWLWFISIIKFAGLTISLYRGWRIKIRFFEMDHHELKKKQI